MDEVSFRFFNPFAATLETRNRLHHWEQDGTLYFVTFRLADSIPADVLHAWKSERNLWLADHPKPWSPALEKEYHQRFSGCIERWLDAGHGSCVLRGESARAEVMNALLHFDGTRCRMVSCIVMPNHVHALFVLNPDWNLTTLIHSWKRHSAQKINPLLGRAGSLWQKDYFDRMIRDGHHFGNCIKYIRRNPTKAKLPVSDFTLFESELAKTVE
ncbi:transposase [Verrucomicrobium sp. BvORR034]|uniref:transposase n=1 Tax=Verrucomicrobium sp. BvORR034 TaxID=1396418 RepID=UPI000679E902|nr:transposase [Verrucomicrobium sp. BvORR034]